MGVILDVNAHRVITAIKLKRINQNAWNLALLIYTGMLLCSNVFASLESIIKMIVVNIVKISMLNGYKIRKEMGNVYVRIIHSYYIRNVSNVVA